ncbi:MAG: hypothetical protein ACOZEN_04150 [Thermodesulfobacteriota bacterium]
MIRKWFRQSTTSALPSAASLGYVAELIRHEARYRRNAQAWSPHLEKSREFISSFIPAGPRKELAVVAGSGLCLDVPLRELSRAFKKVALVDVVHPFETRRLAARLGNVELITADVTGVIESTARVFGQGGGGLPSREPCVPIPGAPDLVVSVNTMAQLPLIPLEKLWTTGAFTDEALTRFARSILEDHLAWLGGFPCVRCLVTDVAWIGVGKEGAMSADPLHGVSMPQPSARWEWKHAPKPEAHPDRDVVHVVAGFDLSG